MTKILNRKQHFEKNTVTEIYKQAYVTAVSTTLTLFQSRHTSKRQKKPKPKQKKQNCISIYNTNQVQKLAFIMRVGKANLYRGRFFC